MDLDFTDEQRMLREAVRELCAKHATPEIVRALEDDPVGFRAETWREMAAMDLAGLAIAEEHGGAGQSALETMILYEELGRVLLPSPHFASAVLAAGLLRAAGTEEQRAEWMPRIARGEAILSCAVFEPGAGEGPGGVRAAARAGTLTGTKVLVPFASAAERLLVLARTGSAERDLTLFLVEASGPGVAMEHTRTMAADSQYRVGFDDAPAEQIGEPNSGWEAWEEASCDGLIALAAQAVGGAEAAHAMAVAYARERVQFGRPIGAFQGIAHPLAEGATEIEGAKVLVAQAAWARASGRPARALAAMAKLYACDVFRRVTKAGQQVFGGIGFTRDIDMQLYFRRAKQLEIAWWGPRALEERIAAAELDADAPFVSIDAGL